ncbi:MAG: cation:proton antiporter [Gammaproteobacteria bacterium]|jgi:Kef-type K+ transport system membrane component KefB
MHDLTSSIEFQMSLLLFVSLAGYLISSRIGQPAVVGQILVGLGIGPSVLGWVTYTDFVSSIAHLGAVILLFVVGLEFKLKDISSFKYLVIGLLGVIVPWAGGYLVATAYEFEHHRAIIIGVALTATSIAITADTLREMGRLNSDVAKAIIGAAVIDDVLALVALSIANEMASGSVSAMSSMMTLLKAIAFLAIGSLAGRYLLSRLVVRIDSSALAPKYPEMVFIFAMMAAFFYGMTAELIGLSAIVGSFVAGVSLEGIGLKNSKSFKEGAEYLRIIFASVFFVSLGVLADVSAMTWELMQFVLVITVVAVITKLIGCGLPAKAMGMNWRDASTLGFGMAPRGEVAMIVALLALNQGVIQQPAYVALVLMALLTTIITPLALRNLLLK